LNFTTLIAWLTEQAERIAYGEIVVKIIKHDGQVRIIEKTVCEKERPTISDTGGAT